MCSAVSNSRSILSTNATRRACFDFRLVLLRLWWVIEELVPDGLWERIAPLLPPPKPRRYPYPGRRPIDDRAALAGIVFVLKTGINWNQLPTGLVGCSGVTCWRRLRDRCAVDGSRVRALKGGTRSARHRSIVAVRAPSII
jgi:transposase